MKALATTRTLSTCYTLVKDSRQGAHIEFEENGYSEILKNKVHYYIVCEYAARENMLNIVNKIHNIPERLTEPLARHWFAQMLQGLKHLHDNGFAHLDLKLDNLLLDDKLNVKIADFGFTLKPNLDGTTTFRRCTMRYAPPEVVRYRGPYNAYKADIFSLG